MTADQLRASILQLAIQGKLVEQRPKEGSAKELLEQIKQEKQNLIAQGKIKKEKPLAPITNEEKPFEIPNSWEWVRLGQLCDIARGGSPRPIKDYLTTSDDGVNWIKIGDTEKNKKYISNTNEKIKKSGISKSRMVYAGDFLLTNSMSFGRPYILRIDGCIHDGWLVIRNRYNVFNQDYLYWLLLSNYAKIQFANKVSGAVVKNLNSEKVSNSIFPLPPLAEQMRIVEKLEQLLPHIDNYEHAYTKLEQLNKRFPLDIKKSLIQYAIQGKLVEQRVEEGNARELLEQIKQEKQNLIAQGKIKKEKPLLPITDEEKPFEIPNSWEWVRLGDIFQHNTGKALNASNREGIKLKYITTSNLYWDKFELDVIKEMFFTDAEIIKCTVKKGDLLVCEGGEVGRAAIWQSDDTILIQNHIHRLRSYKTICTKFFYYIFYLYKHIGLIGGKGIGIKGLSSQAIHIIPLALPPLAEQKRIVEKLEQLLCLCESLE